MQCTIGLTNRQRRWGAVAHTIAVLGLVVLTVATGTTLEGIGGWFACLPQAIELEGGGRGRHRWESCHWGFAWRAGWAWMRRSWLVAAVRSEALMVLLYLSERQQWGWVCLLPWVAWLWQGVGVAWPRLGRQPLYKGMGRVWEQASGMTLLGLGMVWVGERLPACGGYGVGALPVGMCLQHWASEPQVEVGRDEEGVYHVQLSGEFELHVDGNVEFYERMLVIFLGLLEVAGETRASRRTRDGRTPFVRQEQMAAWFGVPHPVISRWFDYWLKQDWRRMLSQRWGEVLTLEVQQRVIASWVKFPWWSARRMWEHLHAQGSRITLNQVRQIGRESGWTTLREALSRVYVISAEAFRPWDEWLTEQLLAQVQRLVERLEVLGGLTPEQQIALADLEALCGELDLRPAVVHRPLPWVLQVERLLFGHWEWVDDGTVRCIYCGTTDVSRKSRKGRPKRYVDAQGNEHTVEVFRYYCHNSACAHKTFTNLPPNLVPYSQWTLEHHLAALQMYEWSHSVYRCTSQLLGVSKMTAYRWVSGLGYQLLPVAALFGVVRSSGVVGIDEKYVLVPKNDKPDEKMKRWMYVYFAVDCYTYDLLHIDIYPYNTKPSARAFLLALRAKGYHPRVIVTDMRVDYRDVVAHVFPKATHHECIFHALQQVHEHFKEAYGLNYAETRQDVAALREEINHIFDARTKRTAQRRYEKVLAQRERFVAETPKADAAFAFLERHWPYLVNATESRHIPRTNNATEEVIRIFTQHYKTFCGFENIETARLYLAVFEKVYRFTPFSDDAQERIRGKCPLELAGYEVQKLPMARLFRGLALQWPASAFEELVPNV
jgi:transposase-like protein